MDMPFRTVYSCDVDGVFVNPASGNVMPSVLVDAVCKMLQEGHIVFANTGRSGQIMFDLALRPISVELKRRESTAIEEGRLFGVAEKGAVQVPSSFLDDLTENREIVGILDPTCVVPPQIGEWIEEEREGRFGDFLCLHPGKFAIITYHRPPELDIEVWTDSWNTDIRDEMSAIANRAIRRAEQKGLVQPSRIHAVVNDDALDIEFARTGKVLGTEVGLRTADALGLDLHRVVGIGDNPSDYGMITTMGRWVAVDPKERAAAYYDVGPNGGAVSDPLVPVITTRSAYEKGCLEAFSNEMSLASSRVPSASTSVPETLS